MVTLALQNLEVACFKHDREKCYYSFEFVMRKLCGEQYDYNTEIPEHSCTPKTLYWIRKAAKQTLPHIINASPHHITFVQKQNAKLEVRREHHPHRIPSSLINLF